MSIYDSEQYLFEIAQNFMRSRIIFTSLELNIFDLLLSTNDGLTCAEIAQTLDLHHIEQQSRCLQDVLDCLTSMNFLERDPKNLTYRSTKSTRNLLLPNRKLLVTIDDEFYKKMSRFEELHLKNTSDASVHQLMLLRIRQLVDLRSYSNISIDCLDENAEVIVLWRQDGLLKEKVKQSFEILASNRKGLLILVVPNDEHDEVTLALNLFLNMLSTNKEQETSKDLYSKKLLKQIGFRAVERVQSTDGLQLLLAYK